MISNIKIPGADIETSSLGFGCAGLMRLASSRARQAVLNEAYDLGVRHFDTARMYGLGKVEEQLGKFLRGKRNTVTLTTKFGIEMKPAVGMAAAIQFAGRIAIQLVPALRKVAHRKSGALYAPRDYSVLAAKRSLEASLSALKTDYVDLFMLHEPTTDAVLHEDILAYLEQARSKGLIRAWGVAGYPDQIIPICKDSPQLTPVLQLPNDVLNRQLEAFRGYRDKAFISFSPNSATLHRIGTYLGKHPELVRSWSDALGMDVGQPRTLAKLVLTYCLNTNAKGIVLFSSTRKEGVRAAAKTWHAQAPADVMHQFSELVAAETALMLVSNEEGLTSRKHSG